MDTKIIEDIYAKGIDQNQFYERILEDDFFISPEVKAALRLKTIDGDIRKLSDNLANCLKAANSFYMYVFSNLGLWGSSISSDSDKSVIAAQDDLDAFYKDWQGQLDAAVKCIKDIGTVLDRRRDLIEGLTEQNGDQ